LWKIRKAQRLNPSELEELQNRRLRAIVKHAYENVPYYHKLFNSAKVKPEDIKTKEDLVKIPITTKKMLQELPINQRVSRGVDINKCIKGRTSGSTGEPLDILFSGKELSHRIAMQTRVYGFNFSNKKVSILDREPTPSQCSPATIFGKLRKYLNHLGLWRRYYFSLFEEPQRLVSKLVEIKPDVIETYPSILKLMAGFMKEKNIRGIAPKIIFTEAELLNEEDREEIEAVFGGKLIDLYGIVEFGIVAWECKEHPGYHVNADIVLVEAIKDNQQVYGEEGEMVCTDLTNYTMPFIRYAVGDIVILSKEKHDCGNNFPVIKLIQGRSNDFITLSSGKVISPLLLGVCLEKIEGIGQYKLVQESKDILNVQIVRGQNFSEATIREFEDALRGTLGSSVHININIVDEIPREKSGKIRPIVSKVPVSL
jgi:phenylacetate-CoA ligase